MRQLITVSIMAALNVAPYTVGAPPRFYQSGSLGANGIPAKPVFPFLTYAEMSPSTVNKEVRKTNPHSQVRTFFVYCYDEHGSGYLRIEQLLGVVRDTLLVLPGQVSPSGARCTDVFWEGNSVDSKDPEYSANMKYSSYRFVVSE